MLPPPEIQLFCAMTAHEANRIYCRAHGDVSHEHWDDAPASARESAIAGVVGALSGATPEQSHEGWLAQKVADGWVYGPAKDATAKTHPCMVPYAELPAVQRVKDGLYLTSVRAMAHALGWPPTAT